MLVALDLVVFSGAFALASFVIAASIAPQWRRIVSLARGNVEGAFTPLHTLAMAERRIAVRRWASASVPAPIHRLRAAA